MKRSMRKSAKPIPPDAFICGQCKLECDTLTAFLQHRANHTGLSSENRCELCPAAFASKASVLEHYAGHHNISLTDRDEDEGIQTDNPYRIIEVGEKDGKIIAVVADPEAEHNDDEADRVYRELVQKNKPDTATEDYLRYRINYKMGMEVMKVQGTKFSYGKTTFSCLFCALQASDIMVLSRHMFKYHKTFVNDLNVEEYEKAFLEEHRQEGKEYGGQLLTLSKYRTCFEPQPQRQTTQLKLRRKRKSKPDTFPCQTCGKVFKQGRLRRVHMETHRTEKNFLCDECGKAFKSRTRLTAHRKSHKEKIFKCQQCDFQSKLHSAIHAHRQVHSHGCVLCHICGSAYTDRSTLTKHLEVHSMDRPYSCAFAGCTWRFKTEALCKAHFRSHTTKGRYKCEICGYLFRHKHHLRRHLTSVHRSELMKHPELRSHLEIHPATQVPAVPLEGGASDMQMIQVVLNQQVHQEVVASDIQGIQVYKLFTS